MFSATSAVPLISARTCGQWKKKLPPLTTKTLLLFSFLLFYCSWSISGCCGTTLITVAKTETKISQRRFGRRQPAVFMLRFETTQDVLREVPPSPRSYLKTGLSWRGCWGQSPGGCCRLPPGGPEADAGAGIPGVSLRRPLRHSDAAVWEPGTGRMICLNDGLAHCRSCK